MKTVESIRPGTEGFHIDMLFVSVGNLALAQRIETPELLADVLPFPSVATPVSQDVAKPGYRFTGERTLEETMAMEAIMVNSRLIVDAIKAGRPTPGQLREIAENVSQRQRSLHHGMGSGRHRR